MRESVFAYFSDLRGILVQFSELGLGLQYERNHESLMKEGIPACYISTESLKNDPCRYVAKNLIYRTTFKL